MPTTISEKQIPNPLISIVMASYNAANFIGEAIDSVAAQTYSKWELLVIDDASNDNTTDIVQQRAKTDHRIQLIQRPQNGGPAKARNEGIRLAQGRFLCFLDADDIMLPEKLGLQVRFMLDHRCLLSYTPYQTMDVSGTPGKVVTVPDQTDYKHLLNGSVIGCLTAMLDLQQSGKQFMAEGLGQEDYTLWLKILKPGGQALALQSVLARYRIHHESFSRSKMRMARRQWAIYREAEKLPLTRSLWHFMHYAVQGAIKAWI